MKVVPHRSKMTGTGQGNMIKNDSGWERYYFHCLAQEDYARECRDPLVRQRCRGIGHHHSECPLRKEEGWKRHRTHRHREKGWKRRGVYQGMTRKGGLESEGLQRNGLQRERWTHVKSPLGIPSGRSPWWKPRVGGDLGELWKSFWALDRVECGV